MKTIATGIDCPNALLANVQYGKYARYPCRFYDDGDGPVWIYRESLGVLGIVRAASWEDAYSICEDEIFDDADPADIADHYREAIAEYREANSGAEGMSDDDILSGGSIDLPECHGDRPNGSGSNRWNQTGIYQTDLNGSALDLLTPELMEDYGIVLTWKTWGED